MTLVTEDTPVGSTIFRDISVEDNDFTGENLEVYCKDYEQVLMPYILFP